MKRKQEKGFATIYVLMLMSVLFILLAVALRFMYQAHNQNRRIRQEINRRVEVLNQTASSPIAKKP